MLYLKLNGKAYRNTSEDRAELRAEYPLCYRRAFAYFRIIERALLQGALVNYPSIDIVINCKLVKSLLGKYCYNNGYRREYKFIKQGTETPYIILFLSNIKSFYGRHAVKGLIKTLWHEYVHFRQWLLNEEMGHGRGLSAHAETGRLNTDLKVLQDILSQVKK